MRTLPESKVLTVKGVAEYLCVHPSTIYHLLRQHELPGFKMGSDWRFNIEEIDRWWVQREKQMVPPGCLPPSAKSSNVYPTNAM